MLPAGTRGPAILLLSCLGIACVSEDRSTVQNLGGAWQIDQVRVSGWEQGYSYLELRHNGKRVDRDIYVEEDYLRFFPPDCVVYRVKRVNAPFYAACGDRTPALLPSWVLSVTGRDILGGIITRGTREIRESAPADEALDAARRQPLRTDDWQSKPHIAVGIEKRLIGSRVLKQPRELDFQRGKSKNAARLSTPGHM